MKTNVIIIDDFYSNPDTVRQFALQQDFSVTGNYPGQRTKTFLTPDVKDAIQRTIIIHAGTVTDWCERDGFTGSFQYTTAADRSWIHSDRFNGWAGVCYLTPNAPHTAGTGLFRHKATGQYEHITTDHEAQDMTKWELFDVIGNKYNRLVLYRGNLFHMSLDYFGKDRYDGRLFQLFFFNTEF